MTILHPSLLLPARILALLLAALLPLAALAGPDPALEKVDKLRQLRQFDAALAGYDELLKKPKNSRERQVGCYWGILDCKRQQKKPADALAAIDQLLAILPKDDPGVRPAAETRYDLLANFNRHEDAAKYADECAELFTAEPDLASNWRYRGATRWLAAKRYAEAVADAAKAAEIARQTENRFRLADSLWLTTDIALAANEPEKALPPLRRLLEFKEEEFQGDFRLRNQNRLGECLVKLNRLPEARQTYESFIAAEPSAEIRLRWRFAIARTWQTEKNVPALLDALDKVLTGQADSTGYGSWFDAQSQIADLLNQTGNLPAALQAARICFDMADSKDRVAASAGRIAQILQQLEKNEAAKKPVEQKPVEKKPENKKAEKKPDLGAIVLSFQRLGPAGTDGVAGTADDLTNPLDAYPRIADPAREKIFAAAETSLGTDVDALIQRGLMRAALGQKKEACSVLLEAFRRAAGKEIEPAANALLFIGVRDVRGHGADLSTFVPFLAYGPTGADGKSTLQDPFAALALPPPGLPSPVADSEALRDLRRRLEWVVEDTNWPENGRRDAITALLRVHAALGDGGEKNVLDWYASRYSVEKDGTVQAGLLSGLLAAARRGEIHWGATRQYLAATATLSPALQRWAEQQATKPSPNSPFILIMKLESTTKATAMFHR